MGSVVYKSAQGEPFCALTLNAGNGEQVDAGVDELSATGAVLAVQADTLELHEYVDAQLQLDGEDAKSMFAHVVEVAGERVVVRWLYFDPGEQDAMGKRLAARLEGDPRVSGFDESSPETRVVQKGKRVVRPQGSRKAGPEAADDYEASDQANGQAHDQNQDGEELQSGNWRNAPAGKDTDALPVAIVSTESFEESAEPVAATPIRRRGRALTSKLVRGLNLPDAESPDDVPPVRSAKELAAAALRVKPPPDAGGKAGGEDARDGGARTGSGVRKAAGTRRVIRPTKRAKPELPDPAESKGGTSRKIARPKVGTRKVTRPEPTAGVPEPMDDLPTGDDSDAYRPAVERPASTRKVVKPKRALVRNKRFVDEADEAEGSRSAADAAARETPPQEPDGDAAAPEPVAAGSTSGTPEPARSAAREDASRPTAPLKAIVDDGSAAARAKEKGDTVAQQVLSRSRRVVASELAARHDTVRILNMSTIKALIKDAVDEAVGQMDLLSLDREDLMEEVERRVSERMQSVEGEKRDLEAKARGLEIQLEAAQKSLDQERDREIHATNFTVSEAGLEDLEKRFNRLVDHAIKADGVNDRLADELRRMVSNLLDSEREKIAAKALAEHNEKMSMLEKKIQRLARSLEETEEERDHNARRLQLVAAHGGGLQNIMEVGLDLEDPSAEIKKELLKTVFEDNIELRRDYQALHGGGLPNSKRAEQLERERQELAEAVERELELEAEAKAEIAAEREEAGAVAEIEAPEAATEAEETLEAEEADELPVLDADETALTDPDDMVWEGPSETFEQQQATKADSNIKVVTDYEAFEPPPLEESGGEAEANDAVSTDEEDPYADMTDPDDMVWDGPNEGSLSQQPAAGDSNVKVVDDYQDREPPPLESGG